MSNFERHDGPPPKKEQPRTANAGPAQSDFAGQCDKSNIMKIGAAEGARPVFDHEYINKIVTFRHLSKAWTGGWGQGPFVFGPRQRIAVKHETGDWFDAKAGRGGNGAISLAAHILSVSSEAAAWRLANFASVRFPSITIDSFVKKDARHG
jgi:hypothetical protein